MSETTSTPVIASACRDGCCLGSFTYVPPLDNAPVLAAHNKLTVLLTNAIEKDAAEVTAVADLHPEDQEWIVDRANGRWWDVMDVLNELEEMVRLRCEVGRSAQRRQDIRA